MVNTEQVVATFDRIKQKHKFGLTLKPEQATIIANICNKRDVFGLLPTGFGKSLTCIALPLILDELQPTQCHSCLVISPLKALMKDQVEYLTQHVINAAAIIEDTSLIDIRIAAPKILFASPEAALQPRWKNFFRDEFAKTASALVFDEAHCISLWGLDFRPSYREMPELQSLLNIPNLALTATATKQIQGDIYQVLGFPPDTTTVVAALPDRQNIFLHVEESSERYEKELSWIVDGIQCGRRKKIINYLRSINLCSQIYIWIYTQLMKRQGEMFCRESVEMFHANTDNSKKDKIVQDIVRPDGEIQVLVSSVAFGRGVNVMGIDIIVHWGIPPTSLNYWQEVGRCARDGRHGYAICYAFKRSQSRCQQDEVKKLVSGQCFGLSILNQFFLIGMDNDQLQTIMTKQACEANCINVCLCESCKCCCVCQRSCQCRAKSEDPLHLFLNS